MGKVSAQRLASRTPLERDSRDLRASPRNRIDGTTLVTEFREIPAAQHGVRGLDSLGGGRSFRFVAMRTAYAITRIASDPVYGQSA